MNNNNLKQCKQCKKEFQSNSNTRKYCSDSCLKESTKNNILLWKKHKSKKTCLVCHKPSHEKKYCSFECRDKNKKRYNLICKYCNKTYESTVKSLRYCSQKCKDDQINKSKKFKEPKIKNQEDIKKICEYCNQEFFTKYSTKKYCGEMCRKHRNINVTFICKQCNQEFVPKDKRNKTFCSRECDFAWREVNFKKHTVIVKCEKCGFKTERVLKEVEKGKRFNCKNCIELKRLSEELKVQSLRELEITAQKEKIMKELKHLEKLSNCICKTCGNKFIGATIRDKYCTEKCRKKNENRSKELRKGKRGKKVKANGEIENDITLEKLIKRDKNKCHICKNECDQKDYILTEEEHFIVGQNYPSIDHVIAITNGGTHTWDNVKLAHHYCNTLKKDKGFIKNEKGQLTLILN